VRSKEWVCGRALAGIAGSNPAGEWISVLSVVCCPVEVSATGRSFNQRISTECVRVWVWSRNFKQWGGHGPPVLSSHGRKNLYLSSECSQKRSHENNKRIKTIHCITFYRATYTVYFWKKPNFDKIVRNDGHLSILFFIESKLWFEASYLPYRRHEYLFCVWRWKTGSADLKFMVAWICQSQFRKTCQVWPVNQGTWNADCPTIRECSKSI